MQNVDSPMRWVLMTVDGQTYALPLTAVDRILRKFRAWIHGRVFVPWICVAQSKGMPKAFLCSGDVLIAEERR